MLIRTLAVCESEQRKGTRESQQSSCDGQDDDSHDSESEGIDLSPCSNHDRAIATFPLPNRQRIALTTNNVRSLSDPDSPGLVTHSDNDDDEEVNPPPDQYSSLINSSCVDTKSTINKRKRKQTRTPSNASKRQRNDDVNNHSKNNAQANVVADPVIIQEYNTKGKQHPSFV
ncbi:unnamed protein product [Rotaria sordida]|uniref:Uncharacterized protein n=1 Tax=Rotaria sordida TaxID=392033 RepID=A0A818J919_9BILA|nr:unnamed protein product [Rotaria sordida]